MFVLSAKIRPFIYYKDVILFKKMGEADEVIGIILVTWRKR